jgi:RimJ/RimL family protein N-acetyltransferase
MHSLLGPGLRLDADRLFIRPYESGDLAARLRLIREGFDPSVSEADVERWLDWTVRNYRELGQLHQPPYGDYAVALKATGEVIGSVGLVPQLIPWDALEPEADPPYLTSPEFGLFWAVEGAHRGRGYATEAARAFTEAVFHDLQARRVVATTDHDNLASQGVMRNLGMAVRRNPRPEPFWCQVVGVLDHT